MLLSSCAAASGVDPRRPSETTADGYVADAGSDTAAARMVATSCAPCRYDFECGHGGACVLDDATAMVGSCRTACAQRGAACDAAGVRATCRASGPRGALLCVPTASCVESTRGAACGACAGRYSICGASEPAAGRTVFACLAPCDRDSLCEDGFSRCASVVRPDGTPARACVPDEAVRPGGCGTAPGSSLIDRALSAGGRSRCDLGFSAESLASFTLASPLDRARLPAFDRVHRDWVGGAAWARGLGPALDARADSLSSLLAAAAALRTSGAADVVAPSHVTVSSRSNSASPLADAVARLVERFGGAADRAALRADAADVPLALQSALADVLASLERAAVARDRGLLGAPSAAQTARLYLAAPHHVLSGYGGNLSGRDLADMGAILGDVVIPLDEASALAATIEAVDWARFGGQSGVSFDASTPVGRVVVRDATSQTYTQESYPETALVVDLGGDDTYLAPVGANASPTNRVSVLIDLGGNDRYGYAERRAALDRGGMLPSDGAERLAADMPVSLSEVNRQGAGRLGVGLLFDLGRGADRYRSLRGSQGFGALGVGGLYDDGGDDVYELEAGGQGGGIFGVGVLLDAGGDDQYTTWFAAQGFGFVRGAGVLYDRDGSDRYVAIDTPVVFPAPQSPGVNASLAQGMGLGRNADAGSDRVAMLGGLGVLRDRAGADRYTATVYGQGAGYLGGIGLLLDGAGDDAYDARYYGQGAGVHLGIGALVDAGGRDVFNAGTRREGLGMGAGHDWGLGMLLADGADDDEYNGLPAGVGAGNANGAGVFLDAGGADTYRMLSRATCGAATGLESNEQRRAQPTLGLFLDAGGGADRYERAGGGSEVVQNDASWLQRTNAARTSEVGMGADGSGPLGM